MVESRRKDERVELTEFLLARIAEDEAAAVEAGADDWEVADQRKVRWVRNGGNAHGWVAIADLSTATAHIARHDPARVLAECDAKRRIVRELETTRKATRAFPGGSSRLAVTYGLDAMLRLLALPYADHPDYDPAWRP